MIAYTTHYVLAGAYKGRSVTARVILRHGSIDGGTTAVCRRVKPDMLSDLVETDEPDCAACRRKLGLSVLP